MFIGQYVALPTSAYSRALFKFSSYDHTHGLPLLVSVDRAALIHVLGRIPGQRLADGPELAICAAAKLFRHAALSGCPIAA